MASRSKGLYEEFARFFEKPTREGLRDLLKKNVGELQNCDFKVQWPALPKLSRILLGIANSGGGCVIIGVAENEDNSLTPKGLEKLLDKADVMNGVKNFLPNACLSLFDVLDFAYDAAEYPLIVGKRFQVIFMEDDPHHLPFVSTRNGEDIRGGAVYVRRGATTEEATYEELQSIINRRLETGYSSQREISLETHLEQLKVLFRQMDRFHVSLVGGWAQTLASLTQSLSVFGPHKVETPNPMYPEEDFEVFMVNMIKRKKTRIEKELDI